MTSPSSSANTSDATPAAAASGAQGAAATAEDRHLKRCPRCEYSLAGLPRKHRCPECGLEYDEHTRVWEVRKPWALRGVLLLVLFGLLAIEALFYCLYPTGVFASQWAGAIFLLVSVVLFVRQWLLNHRRDFAAVTPKGVMLRLQAFRTRVVPWARVVDVDLDAFGRRGRATLNYRAGKLVKFITVRRVLHTDADRQQFAEAVRDGKERYSAHPSSDAAGE